MTTTSKTASGNASKKRRRVVKTFTKRSRTKQEFKNECDINRIVAQYSTTGVLTHVNRMQPAFGNASAPDFTDAMHMIDEVKEAFASLPAILRRRFDGKPEQFLEFLHDPKNALEIAEMGLLSPEATQTLREEEINRQNPPELPENPPKELDPSD